MPRVCVPAWKSSLAIALLLASWTFDVHIHAADAPATVQPVSVRKLVADGKHNAFTALTKFNGAFWLAFRSAKDHNSQDGEIVLLRSASGDDWTEVRRFNFNPDDRDPQFLATTDRLILYSASMNGPRLTTFAVHTSDGQEWSEPQTVYEPQFILWKPLVAGDSFLATAHRKVEGNDGGKTREVHLIRSTDGLKWEKVSTIRAGNWESETTLLAGPGDHLTAFIRTKYSVPGHIMESPPPYQEWSQRPAGIHLSGHAVRIFSGVTYLLSRTFDDSGKNAGTTIYTYADGKPIPYCVLPAGGDCAYPEAVELGDEMLVSYYSTHEGSTNIYLARVPLKK